MKRRCRMSTVFVCSTSLVAGVCLIFLWTIATSTDSSTDHSNIQHTKSDGYIVPNIVHYIWFAKDHRKQLLFLHYISVVSAYRHQQPRAIWFHCNHIPTGVWWDRLWQEVPVIRVKYRSPPDYIHGQRLAHVYHKGDVAKMDILLQHGGIYLDYDVIVINSLNPLRVYDVTIGKEKTERLNFGVVIARENAEFLRLLHLSYKDNYHPRDWDYNCAVVAYEIYRNHSQLIHVEPHKLTTPDWLERHLLWNDTIDWRSLYVLHVLGQVKTKFNPNNIRALNSTFGQVMRFIYYREV